MDVHEENSWSRTYNEFGNQSDHEIEVLMEDQMIKRGPWTVEEDVVLMNYITKHGEGRWNSLSRSAGLKRTGKSCRLRWLNYLRPDIRRGNITLREQLLILDLHSRWGNRWSKIAECLPGRTDNEIKNYWRTRVQKHAKQLKCDVNSKQFKDTMRHIWMPRLVERIQAESAKTSTTSIVSSDDENNNNSCMNIVDYDQLGLPITGAAYKDFGSPQTNELYDLPEQSSPTTIASDSFGSTQVMMSNIYDPYYSINGDGNNRDQQCYPDSLISPTGYFSHDLNFSEHSFDSQWLDQTDNLWNMDDIWFIQ